MDANSEVCGSRDVGRVGLDGGCKPGHGLFELSIDHAVETSVVEIE